MGELKHAQELIDINQKISFLLREKELISRKFIRANANIPFPVLIKAAIHLCGFGFALYWYIRAHECEPIKARQELMALYQKDTP